MTQFLLTLAAVLIGGFLALLGYDRFIVQPRQAERGDAVADAATAPASVTAIMRTPTCSRRFQREMSFINRK